MPKIALYLQSSADKRIRDGVSPGNAPLTKAVKQGDKTLRDSGALASSITRHHGSLWADASTNLHYAKLQQRGGTIQGGTKGLWIPAGSETRRLMRKYNARSAGSLIKAMKNDKYNFYRRNNVFIAIKGAKGKPFALFIIKKSVRIPSRPFLYIDKNNERFIAKIIQQSVFKSLGE